MAFGVINNNPALPKPSGTGGPSPYGKQYSAGGIDFSVASKPLQPAPPGPGPLKYVHDGSSIGDSAILRAYYGAGGEFYPELFSDLGIYSDAIAQNSKQDSVANEPQQGPQMDPFFQLALQFLYPNGIPGQDQGSPLGSGVDPRRNPNYQPPATPPPDPLQALLGELGGIDPLLQQLLGGFNPQPQPAPPYFNQGLGKF